MESLSTSKILQELPIIESLFMYWYNVEPEDILRALYTDPAPSNLKEKKTLASRGLIVFWGQLDKQHKQLLLSLATDRYLEEITRRHLLDLESHRL